MSSVKATQTSTKYYLYNPLTGERHEQTYDDFGDACTAMRSLRPRIWEVHVDSGKRKK